MINVIKNILNTMANGLSFSHEAELQSRQKKTDSLYGFNPKSVQSTSRTQDSNKLFLDSNIPAQLIQDGNPFQFYKIFSH